MLMLCVDTANSSVLHATSVIPGAVGLLAALVYIATALLETSVHPYDVLECEPELVSGYYVDYGGVSFMVLYLAEGLLLTCLLLLAIAWWQQVHCPAAWHVGLMS